MVMAVVVTGPGRWALGDQPEERPGPGEVELEMVSAGICGGDRALLKGANAVARYPLVLGHECVGRIVDPGDTHRTPGEFVVVYPTMPCSNCPACRAGRGNQCPDMVVMGLSHERGCFAERFIARTEQCISVPDHLAELYGALIEPVAVAAHITSRSDLRAGESILIIGAGAIGLTLAAVARSLGVERVACVDQHPSRSEIARALGVELFTTKQDEALLGWLAREAGHIDVVFDTVVTGATAAAALETLPPGGRYAPVASSKPGQILPVPYDRFFLKELAMVTARNYVPSDFDRAIRLLDAERPDLTPLVTGRYPLDRFEEALAELEGHPERHVKILVHPPGNIR